MNGAAVRNAAYPANWLQIFTGVTDADGRCHELAHDAAPGVYRLVFDIAGYLARLGRAGIYPEITITFTCSGEAHDHLPLPLTDNSYTTDRGS